MEKIVIDIKPNTTKEQIEEYKNILKSESNKKCPPARPH